MACLRPRDFKSLVSTSFTTRAMLSFGSEGRDRTDVPSLRTIETHRGRWIIEWGYSLDQLRIIVRILSVKSSKMTQSWCSTLSIIKNDSCPRSVALRTFVLGVAVLGAALAQTYPNKSIRIVTASAGPAAISSRADRAETSRPARSADNNRQSHPELSPRKLWPNRRPMVTPCSSTRTRLGICHCYRARPMIRCGILRRSLW